MRPRSLAALLTACAAVGSLTWLARPTPAPDPVPPAALGRAVESSPEAQPATVGGSPQSESPHAEATAPPPGPAPPAPDASPAAGADPPALLSSVRHRVLRSWGAAAGSGPSGPRELHLVVEPSLGTRELEQLLRDAFAQHAEADVLTVRIYDSEAAVTYDRHSDGGALAERHLIASLSRHRRLGVESLRVRGVELDP